MYRFEACQWLALVLLAVFKRLHGILDSLYRD